MFKSILFLDKHKVGCNFSTAGILVADKGFGFAMILVVAGIQCGGASQNKKIYTPKIYITSDKKIWWFGNYSFANVAIYILNFGV